MVIAAFLGCGIARHAIDLVRKGEGYFAGNWSKRLVYNGAEPRLFISKHLGQFFWW